jgi:hypothetical protein
MQDLTHDLVMVEAAGVELFHILCYLQLADSTKGINGIKGHTANFAVRVSYTPIGSVSQRRQSQRVRLAELGRLQSRLDQLMNVTNDGPKGMADPLKPRLDVAESKAK